MKKTAFLTKRTSGCSEEAPVREDAFNFSAPYESVPALNTTVGEDSISVSESRAVLEIQDKNSVSIPQAAFEIQPFQTEIGTCICASLLQLSNGFELSS